MKKNIINFSTLLALFIGVINIIDFTVNNVLFENFALSTYKIFAEMEFWRLLSYHFFAGTVETILLSLAIFIFISPKLEYFLGTKIYFFFLSLISFVVGAITVIIFNSKSIIIGGMEGVSFFIFTIFVMLLVKDKHIKERQPALAIGICTVIFWGIFKYFIAKTNGFESIFPSIVISFSGIMLGLLVYLQIYLLIKSRIKKAKMRMRAIKSVRTPSSEELSLAMFNNPNFREMLASSSFLKSGFAAQTKEQNHSDVEIDYDDETRLNFILDKINESGKDSITSEELSFLENYSKK